MPTTKEIDAAFAVAQQEARWSMNKLPLVRRMLEAVEAVQTEEMRKQMAGFSPETQAELRRMHER